MAVQNFTYDELQLQLTFFQYQGFGTILVEIIKINLATSENIFDTGFSIIRKFHRYIIHFRIWQQYSDIAIGATR